MPRRKRSLKRKIEPDYLYKKESINRVINKILLHGKKSTAERVLYGALEFIKEKSKKDPVEVFDAALKNIKPVMEVKSRRVGGSNYQVPVEVRPDRSMALAIRWLVRYSRERSGKSMIQKLAAEIMDAANKSGGAFKKREETHHMAESNKAFAHFRW